MEVYCTRPTCPRPANQFPDLSVGNTIKTVQQKYCTTCGMPLILIGRYLPERLLGKGGFGAAFLARDRYTPTMRQCVVKLFQPAAELNPEQFQLAQTLFEREAAVLEELGNRHPQIPDLYAFFPLMVPSQQLHKQEEYFYLVQEYIDGKDLEITMAERGAFPEAEVLEILQSMLKVLTFVHENGTIHRDIKPSNIMRHRNGRLYLLDFGAVKQVASSTPGAQARSTGIYSMGYAPPEQMAGGTVYPSTDLYALAVTCITLLTGKAASDLYDAYNNVWSWRSYVQVSDRLEAVLNRMLQSTPNQRFATAEDVLIALQQPQSPAVSSTPTPVVPTSPPNPTAMPAPAPPVVAPPVPTPAPPAPVPAKSAPAPVPPAMHTANPVGIAAFSLVEFLGAAAFTGFQGGLLAVVIFSFLGTTLLGSGAWLLLLVGLVLLQMRRVIERVDLIIIAGVSLGAILLFPPLRVVLSAQSSPTQAVIALAIMAALVAVSVATLFRLIYRILSSFM